MRTDTIAAIATAVSNGGISIIRISGNKAFDIIDRIYRSLLGNKILSKEKSHTIHYGYIVDNDYIIDEIMVSIMRAPKSYTTEDVVEINCHGGIVVTKKILELVIKQGARIAEPGEFTKRAFLNGRIDLSQAEAIGDIINAKNELSLKNSISQLRGNLFHKIVEIRTSIIRNIAFIESALDDPEHISLTNYNNELSHHIDFYLKELDQLLKSSNNGRLLKEGIKTVILGKPNAGKSSLMNLLLGEERAIVTEIEGTTRDTIEEYIQLGGISLNIIDTAGIRSTNDIVEKIGVDKALRIAEEADLLIYVVDATRNLDENDLSIIEFIKNKKSIILLNKTDLEIVIDVKYLEEVAFKEIIQISAKLGNGLIELENWIKKVFFRGELTFNDEIFITNLRHKDAILNSINSLNMVKESVELGMPEDFYSIDLMNAYETLGSVIGESLDEDLVNTIFREFCTGK